MTQLVDEAEFLCDCCELVTDGDERRWTLVMRTDSEWSWVGVDLCALCWMDHFTELGDGQYAWRRCETPAH